MATAGSSSDEEDTELKDIDVDISKLRSAKKELFEIARPINDKLERIRQIEQQLVDKHHRFICDKLESQLKQAQSENVRLKQSLDQAAKHSKSQLKRTAELEDKVAAAETQSGSAKDDAQTLPKAVDSWTVGKLKKQLNHTTKLLNETKEELNETRQRLSAVQDRLTLSEQVTAATQQRALQEFDNSGQLQLELMTPQLQTALHAGIYVTISLIFYISAIYGISNFPFVICILKNLDLPLVYSKSIIPLIFTNLCIFCGLQRMHSWLRCTA